MRHSASAEDRAFRAAFEACDIAPADFRHRDHLRLVYVYLCDGDDASAIRKVRAALLKFLDFNNVPAGKYHETLTGSWAKAVTHFMRHTAAKTSFDEFIDENVLLLNTDIMLSHYSKERLFSDIARNEFLEPDLEPIP